LDYNILPIMLDLDNSKLVSLSTNPLEFKSSDNNPITISKNLLSDKILYKFNKSQLSDLLVKYKQFNHIYNLTNMTINIAYTISSFDNVNNLVFNPNTNDIAMIN